MSTESVLKTIADEDIEYVDIRFTDPRGKLQHVTVMSDQVDADFIEEGFMFDGSSIAGWKSIEASNMKLMSLGNLDQIIIVLLSLYLQNQT